MQLPRGIVRLDSSAICVRLVVFSPRCFPEGPAPSPRPPYRRHMEVGRGVGRPSRETRHTSRISQRQERGSRLAIGQNTGCGGSSSFSIHARLAGPPTDIYYRYRCVVVDVVVADNKNKTARGRANTAVEYWQQAAARTTRSEEEKNTVEHDTGHGGTLGAARHDAVRPVYRDTRFTVTPPGVK